jgi:hypothetical protein
MGALKKILVGMLLLSGSPAHADWTWNLSYQNPAVSTFGVNLFYMGNPWGFEVGLGWIDVDASKRDEEEDKDDGKKKDDDSARIRLAGDVDVKYMLASGKFRPYVQGGFGVGLGADSDAGAGASTGGGFAGLGILAGSPSFYVYGTYNINGSRHDFVQAGLGFDL